ncbi:MAG TPA: deaminase [Candidatus Bathyarchaeia archaeon]|nr:deaminase [Candidatus Bathyarchaeia archaeon]
MADTKKPAFKRPSWDAYFMALAKLAASRSTCISRPTGCVMVKDKQIISTGFNGSMPGVPHCSDEGECYRRSIKASDAGKYDFCRSIHSEANAVALAARAGASLEGATCYHTLFPCYVCTKLLVRAGIKEMVYEFGYDSKNAERDKHWQEVIDEAGIKIRQVKLSEVDKKCFEGFLEENTSRRRLKSE